MRYRIEVYGYGNEIGAAKASAEMARFVKEECGGDMDEYVRMAEAGEIPDEAYAFNDFWDSFDFAEWHRYGAGPYATVTVMRADTEDEVYSSELRDVPGYDTTDTDFSGNAHWVANSEEKGLWFAAEFDVDGEFDPELLSARADALVCSGGDIRYEILKGMSYGGNEIEGEFDSSDGKGASLRFFDDTEI